MDNGVKMVCSQGHVWVETYPKSHPSYGKCPECKPYTSPPVGRPV